MDRRTFLTAVGGSTAAAVAGCTSRPEGSGSGTPTSSAGSVDPGTSTSSVGSVDVDGRWRMADHDAGGSGHNPAVTPSRPGEPEWTVTLPPERFPTRPAIGRDRVYLGVRNSGPTPATTTVQARSLDDGAVEWSAATPYSGVRSPALGPGPDGDPTLFVVSGQDHSNTGPGEGVVRALDPASGERLWEWSAGAVTRGAPVVADGTVVVTTNALDHVAAHALDAAGGTRRWSFPAEGWLHRTPTVADGTVYLSSTREELAALSLADGSVRWRAATRADDTRPVVDPYRDLVYVGHSRGLEAFDRADGDRAWEFVASGPETADEDLLGVVDEPVVAPDRLVVRTSDTSPFHFGDVGHCHGVDPTDGSRTWRLPGGRPVGSPVGAGGHALLLRADSAAAVAPPGGDPAVDPGAAATVAVRADGSVAWERRGRWDPAGVGDGRLVAYRGRGSASGRVDVACFAV